MPAHLLFVHGWAYDANIWGLVRSRLGNPPATVWERGYFEEVGVYGAASEPQPPPGPYIAVGHSLGVMRLLRERPEGCIGLISVCGFARFSATEGFPGTSARVLDRMLTRFKANPRGVTAEFRARCGSGQTQVYDVDVQRMYDDLLMLRDGDERAAAAALDIPVLSLTGSADPIVSAGQTDASFPDAEKASMQGVGHLLPLRTPEWCAAQIAAFAGRLAR